MATKVGMYLATHSVSLLELLELFFSCCIVVAVAKENLLKTPAIVSLANFQRIQMLRHPRLAFDWLSVSFFDYLPIRMSGLLLLCTELTLFCIELPENCIYLNQSELSNFFMYITRPEKKIQARKGLKVISHHYMRCIKCGAFCIVCGEVSIISVTLNAVLCGIYVVLFTLHAMLFCHCMLWSVYDALFIFTYVYLIFIFMYFLYEVLFILILYVVQQHS